MRSRLTSSSSIVLFLLVSSVARVNADDGLGFEPLPASAFVGNLDETEPFLLADGFQQQLVTSVQADADVPIVSTEDGLAMSQLGLGDPAGQSNFDMLTLNETGSDQGRYLFRAHRLPVFCGEVLGGTCVGGNAGVSRTDLETGDTVTIAQRKVFDNFSGLEWTPWGTLLVGEEASTHTFPPEIAGFEVTFSPTPDPAVQPPAAHGLLYEITNPLAAPADINVVARPAVGSMAHQGIQIDGNGNLYVVDYFPFRVGGAPLPGAGAIYRFVPSSPADMSNGQLFVLEDLSADDGPQIGAAEWVPLTEVSGNPLANITNPAVDARAAADDVGAEYIGIEHLLVGQLANGNDVLFAASSIDQRVLSIELAEQPVVRGFVTRDTIDLSSGSSVGEDLKSPDGLAIDSDGRIYIVEDEAPGDVWAAVDDDRDGVAEGIGRWASLSTPGSEPSGLYFSPFDPNVAYINVMHPDYRPPEDALGDATFAITSPGGPPLLLAGDANMDLEFNQADIVSVLIGGKYLTGQAATWGEGDWDGAPGGSPGIPPDGDGLFNQLDIVAAQQAGTYLAGHYAGLHGEALAAAVPEPGSFVLLGIGLLTFSSVGWLHSRWINR